MKKIFSIFLLSGVCGLMAVSCDFLDPLPDGSYNEDNYKDYHKIIRGFIDKAYSLRPGDYFATEFIGTDAGTDNAVYSDPSAAMRELSMGNGKMSSNPFTSIWTRDYQGINYCNMFLKDGIGLNTQYLLDPESDRVLARSLQGDAYALRAWYHYELLKTFGGVATNGKLMGVPIRTEQTDVAELDNSDIVRATFDETVLQILRDCDSAQVYLPYNNRDYPGDPVYSSPISGSARYRTFDRVSLDGLRAMVYLLWASPAFNPETDITRYQKAAQYAANVIKHKLEVESKLTGGFDPKAGFSWHNLNSPEVINISTSFLQNSNVEEGFYPAGFKGKAKFGASQDLVDAFPAANGYPITDHRSQYDPFDPYRNRDPRLYATVFHNGSKVRRITNSDVMYTFETSEDGGKDAPDQTNASPTGYYIRKFIYLGWNPYDSNIVKAYRSIFYMRWEQMCLIFAEAASKAYSPTDMTYGLSAKQALSYLRSRPTEDDVPGIGASSDPYLDECAASPQLFEALVKNEWRINTCFEGMHFYNLRRWTADHDDLSAINVDVHGVSVTGRLTDGYSYSQTIMERRNYPSLWVPLPYMDVRRCPNLLQNKGWESWR